MGSNCRRELVYATYILDLASPRCIANACPKSVRPGAKTPPLVKPMLTTAKSVCPKCGHTKESGKRSCCARGGAWFQNCGEADDKHFDHTWVEGIQACKSKLWRWWVLCHALWWVLLLKLFVVANYDTWDCDGLFTTTKWWSMVVSVCCVIITPAFPTAAPTKKWLSAVSSSSNNNNRCLKCSITQKSDELSCCARGGAWFKNCGDAGDTRFDHTWFEGVQSCAGSATLVLVESTPMTMLGDARVIVNPLSTAWSLNITGQQKKIKCLGSVSHAGTMDSEDCVSTANVVVCICVLLIISRLHSRIDFS